MKGIYLIENQKFNEKYIGSSYKIHSRWGTHLRLLLQNKHHSVQLQESFNKSDISDLKFSILKIVDNKVSDKELEALESEYSVSIEGFINRLPQTTDGKCNFTHTRATVISILKSQNRYRPIYIIDTDNNILGEYELQWEAAESAHVGLASMRDCLIHKRYHRKGFGFIYKDEYNKHILTKARIRKWSDKERHLIRNRIKIEVYTIYGDFYKEMDSIQSCAREFDASPGNLFHTLNKFPKKILYKSEISKYIFVKSDLKDKNKLISEWKTKYDVYKQSMIDNIGNIKIYDLYDVFLGTSSYENISVSLGVEILSIKEIIKGKRIQAKGFKFML